MNGRSVIVGVIVGAAAASGAGIVAAWLHARAGDEPRRQSHREVRELLAVAVALAMLVAVGGMIGLAVFGRVVPANLETIGTSLVTGTLGLLATSPGDTRRREADVDREERRRAEELERLERLWRHPPMPTRVVVDQPVGEPVPVEAVEPAVEPAE